LSSHNLTQISYTARSSLHICEFTISGFAY